MIQLVRWFALIGVLVLLAGLTWAQPDGAFTDELRADLYDCTLTLQPEKTVKPTAAVTVYLDWTDAQTYTRVRLTSTQLTIDALTAEKTTRCGEAKMKVTPGAALTLTLMRRGDTLGVLLGDVMLFRGRAPRTHADDGGVIADAGWTVVDTQVQRLAPVVFADNFMRTKETEGAWTAQSGRWGLQSAWDADPHGNNYRFSYASYAQNPFEWSGRGADGAPTTPALCTTGEAFWEDYTFTTAVRPAEGGAVGAAVNLTDAQNGLLVRWSPANDRGAQGDRLSLYRLVNGERKLLKEERGGYVPGQWYKLSVTSTLEGVRVAIDGLERLAVNDVTPRRGAVGLYAEGARLAAFDDIFVYGRTLDTSLIQEADQVRVADRVDEDNKMGVWADQSKEWQYTASVPGARLHRQQFYGDQWLACKLTKRSSRTGDFWLSLQTDGKTETSGFRAVIKTGVLPEETIYTLYRDAEQLATLTDTTLAANEEYAVRFLHVGARVWLEVDGEVKLEAKAVKPLPGSRPMYRASGALAQVADLVVLSTNLLNYTFSNAPVDWFDEGTWMPTVRWACAPQWSFLAGWNRGDAVLWHKQIFTGDQTFEAFVGLKMEYPRETEIYYHRYRDMAITICGDGHNTRTGYTGVYGAAGENGTPNQRVVLLRNGVEVAAMPDSMPGYDTAHRDWFHLELRKNGANIEFWVGGQLKLTYTDPAPIAGGTPAIWTTNNGISVARARIIYTNPPQLRRDPQVILDAPAYGEWVNVGQPLSLDFTQSWSTTGKPVSLQVTRKAAPAGAEATVKVEGLRVTFTANTTGNYWYEIRATDGKNVSPAYHLSVQGFDPAKGRDDSHALLLYRFTESEGRVVHDLAGGEGTAVDLNISNPKLAHWLPGQGLEVQGNSPLMSRRMTDKLAAIAKNQACTVELWISTETLNPPTENWNGTFITWQQPGQSPNFAVGHHQANLGNFLHETNLRFIKHLYYGEPNIEVEEGFRMNLHHWVLTWDGEKTCWYRDGALLKEATQAWNTETWTSKGLLMLGNNTELRGGYIGSYFLTAVHDRGLTADEVTRHYLAGPSATMTVKK